MTTRKEHFVRETNAEGRTTWTSAEHGFCATADDNLRGSAELHAATAKAFALTGDDRVWVVGEDGVVCDVVSLQTIEQVAA